MRIFDSNRHERWGHKVNFADGANTLVGYDMDQDCCEHAGWTIAERPATSISDGRAQWADAELDPYAFDVATEPIKGSIPASELEAGDSISFRLVADGKPDLWLTLFNAHNGYYAHGFTVDVGGKRALDGYL